MQPQRRRDEEDPFRAGGGDRLVTEKVAMDKGGLQRPEQGLSGKSPPLSRQRVFIVPPEQNSVIAVGQPFLPFSELLLLCVCSHSVSGGAEGWWVEWMTGFSKGRLRSLI